GCPGVVDVEGWASGCRVPTEEGRVKEGIDREGLRGIPGAAPEGDGQTLEGVTATHFPISLERDRRRVLECADVRSDNERPRGSLEARDSLIGPPNPVRVGAGANHELVLQAGPVRRVHEVDPIVQILVHDLAITRDAYSPSRAIAARKVVAPGGALPAFPRRDAIRSVERDPDHRRATSRCVASIVSSGVRGRAGGGGRRSGPVGEDAEQATGRDHPDAGAAGA